MKGQALKNQAPFYETLEYYLQKGNVIFHTPGHRGGKSLGDVWQASPILQLDLTELSGLDWQGSQAAAMALAAEFYQADRSWFLVQGATQGIIAAILGAFKPGDRVLVGRNVHRSVINGLVLGDLQPIFIEIDYLPNWGIATGVNWDALRRAVVKYPDAKGLIVTNPTYQGIASPIQLYREIIGERILIVDEAHGGHFGWWGEVGYDAHESADAWVQGTHKFLGSLTQTGMLHLKGNRINEQRVEQQLELISTTSPSFILLAALDVNRAFLQQEGQQLFASGLAKARELKEKLASLSGVAVLTDADLVESERKIDPWRLVCSFLANGFTGFEAERILRENYSVQGEYADYNQITFLIAPWQDLQDIEKLINGICGLIESPAQAALKALDYPLPIPRLGMMPRQAVYGPVAKVPLVKAEGDIAARTIAPYPPGIPLVGPGEEISSEVIQMVLEIQQAGGIINGLNSENEILISTAKADINE